MAIVIFGVIAAQHELDRNPFSSKTIIKDRGPFPELPPSPVEISVLMSPDDVCA
jgi:hypothetical protein